MEIDDDQDPITCMVCGEDVDVEYCVAFYGGEEGVCEDCAGEWGGF